jgi:predicted peroxiredoxin
MTTERKESRDLVVMISSGIDHEKSSVGFTIACGGITAGLRVCVFLTSAGVDLVRKNGTDLTQVAPLDPLRTLIRDFMERGGKIWACPPCVKTRGYSQDDLLPGVEIVGASAMHALILQGAATLSF